MAGTGDDGGFSDDELDALAGDDLLALEDAAFQRHPEPATAYRAGLHGLSQASIGAHGSVVSRNIGREAHEPSLGGYRAANETVDGPPPDVGRIGQHTRTRGLDDLQGLDEVAQREQWRLNRFAGPNVSTSYTGSKGNISLPHRSPGPAFQSQFPDAGIHGPSVRDEGVAEPSVDIQKLQAELKQLRIEKEGLQNAVKAANDQLLAKSGEVSIIRSNQARATNDYEKRIEALQQQHHLDNERHRVDLEQARKEKEKLVTHNQFLDHEMNDQTWQLRRVQKASRSNGRGNQIRNETTPKKPRTAPFGDGFSEDELALISPSKAANRSKSTPKAGSKRKRDVLGESPVQPLEFTGDGASFQSDNLLNIVAKQSSDAASKDKDRLKLLQHLLDRRIARGEKRTFEILTGYMFPSDQRNTLSSLFVDRLTPLSAKQDIENFPSAIGQIVLSLWSGCLEESFHEPIRYLLDLVQFLLFNGSTATASSLMDELVDLAQRTADINIIPRYKRFKRKAAADGPESRTLNPKIDTLECLNMLELTISLCQQNEELVKRFWRSMRFDFISMLLRNSQDLDDVQATVRLLFTSIRPDSFAMIVAPPASQSVSEQHVIDRLSSMLIEVPRKAEGEKPYNAVEICTMRLEILNLVEAMCREQYCGEAFARHPAAIGRLVRVMHDELNALYEWTHGHELRAELVNNATRLLYGFVTDYAPAVGDLQEKLRAPPTNVKKHLIVLSRLAFSEGIFFEADIEEDVLDMAHQMLEELVTPEEGEALQKAFVWETREEKRTREGTREETKEVTRENSGEDT